MTEEEFEEFNESLSQSLFHVLSDDIDDETGASLEEVILVQHLASNPKALARKPLKQWVEEFVGKCYLEDLKRKNEEILAKQNQIKSV
jgi:translation elongation factor EF-4